jgi:hypothetical protein
VSELADLYSRYKLLGLGVGAQLLLGTDEEGSGLSAETLRLAADAGRLRETHAAPENHAAEACHRAALDLHRLAAAAPGSPGHTTLIEQVRASHKALRALLWDDIADQYAPCGAHPHRHLQEEHDRV